MDYIKAAKLVMTQYKNRFPISYCKIKEGVVINTRAIFYDGNTTPAQYLVYNSEDVLPTNPMSFDFGSKKFIRILPSELSEKEMTQKIMQDRE